MNEQPIRIPRKKPNWRSVDWTMRRCDVAKKLGVNPATVTRYCRRHGIPEPANHMNRDCRIPWETVDWSYSDTAIRKSLQASGHKCSRQAVWKSRRIYEKKLKHFNQP